MVKFFISIWWIVWVIGHDSVGHMGQWVTWSFCVTRCHLWEGQLSKMRKIQILSKLVMQSIWPFSKLSFQTKTHSTRLPRLQRFSDSSALEYTPLHSRSLSMFVSRLCSLLPPSTANILYGHLNLYLIIHTGMSLFIYQSYAVILLSSIKPLRFSGWCAVWGGAIEVGWSGVENLPNKEKLVTNPIWLQASNTQWEECCKWSHAHLRPYSEKAKSTKKHF